MMFYEVIVYRIVDFLIVSRADLILTSFAGPDLYLVLAICIALLYKVQHWTTVNTTRV